MERPSGELRSVVNWTSAYFGLQAALVVAWWVWMLASPEARGLFKPAGFPDAALFAFAAPDVLIVAGSVWIAVQIWRGRAVWSVIWGVAGCVAYGTVYCLAQSLATGEAWGAAAAMTVMSITMGLIVMSYVVYQFPEAPFFREAKPASPGYQLGKTLAMMSFFWVVFFVGMPGYFVWLEGQMGLGGVAFRGQWAVGLAVFVGAGALGVWSAVVMSTRGNGTPLPVDAPRELVATGPYAFLRNPMALAGLVQGFAVGLMAGSVLTCLYVVLGTIYWDRIVRPLEERDLSRRFGESFERYRRTVPLWIPRRPRV